MRLALIIAGVIPALAAAGRLGSPLADPPAPLPALPFRSPLHPHKLARRKFVRERLLSDPAVADAVRAHASSEGISEAAAWRRVNEYVTEIVPFFNIVAYYQIGYRAAKVVLRFFYNVTVEYQGPSL